MQNKYGKVGWREARNKRSVGITIFGNHEDKINCKLTNIF